MSNKAIDQQNQLELAVAIMKTNHPFSYTVDSHHMEWIKSMTITPYEAITVNCQLRLELIQPPDGLPIRNPHNLTPDQVGAGYRLVTSYEAENNLHQDQVEIWFSIAEPIGWRKFPAVDMKANSGSSIRVPASCPFKTKPAWQLPAPPAGKQWHATGWVENDLPPGYRPLLLNEKREDEDEMTYYPPKGSYIFTWGKVAHVRSSVFSPDLVAKRNSNKSRTTRPLPSEPCLVRLEAKDIPPGSAIRQPDWNDGTYDMIISVGTDRIHNSFNHISYKTLMEDEWLIRYPGTDKWFPCHKQSS